MVEDRSHMWYVSIVAVVAIVAVVVLVNSANTGYGSANAATTNSDDAVTGYVPWFTKILPKKAVNQTSQQRQEDTKKKPTNRIQSLTPVPRRTTTTITPAGLPVCDYSREMPYSEDVVLDITAPSDYSTHYTGERISARVDARDTRRNCKLPASSVKWMFHRYYTEREAAGNPIETRTTTRTQGGREVVVQQERNADIGSGYSKMIDTAWLEQGSYQLSVRYDGIFAGEMQAPSRGERVKTIYLTNGRGIPTITIVNPSRGSAHYSGSPLLVNAQINYGNMSSAVVDPLSPKPEWQFQRTDAPHALMIFRNKNNENIPTNTIVPGTYSITARLGTRYGWATDSTSVTFR